MDVTGIGGTTIATSIASITATGMTAGGKQMHGVRAYWPRMRAFIRGQWDLVAPQATLRGAMCLSSRANLPATRRTS